MDFNLTNEEIVYIYEQLKAYKQGIDNHYGKALPFMSKQLELFKETFDDMPEEERQQMNLRSELINKVLPESLKVRIDFLDALLGKLTPIYEMIEESDPTFVRNVVDTLIEVPEKMREISNQLKNSHYGGQDIF